LRYSLVAHAYSNLRFEARLRQESFKPGATVTLEASLDAYDVAFVGDASVWADVTTPDSKSVLVRMARLADGQFSGNFVASMPGVYPCRVRAEGYFKSKDKFTREKRLTAAVFNGEPGGSSPQDDPLCSLLHCLTSEKILNERFFERLRQMGVDMEALLKCLESHCRGPREHAPPKVAGRVARRPADRSPSIRTEPETRPAERPVVKDMPKEFPRHEMPRIVRMFSREAEDMGDRRRMADVKTGPAAHRFPRRVRRFSRPEPEGKK